MIHNSTFHRLLYLASTCLTFNSLKIYLAFTFSLLCELRHSKNVLYTRFSAFWLSPPSCRHASGSLLLGDFPVTCVCTCCELPRALCYLISALRGGLGYCVGLGTECSGVKCSINHFSCTWCLYGDRVAALFVPFCLSSSRFWVMCVCVFGRELGLDLYLSHVEKRS